MLQIPVMPGRGTAWLVHGDDIVGGYVVKAQDALWATTPSALIQAHGLGFSGSPFSESSPFVDVLRMPESTGMNYTTPFGRPSTVASTNVEGSFVEHPPFTGTGFMPSPDHVVPFWWLDPVRLPPRSEIWRISADGTQNAIAVYPHVALGWVPVNGFRVEQSNGLRPSDLLGTFGTWNGQRMIVDVLSDGTAVVGSAAEVPGAGLQPGPRGVWWRSVPQSEVSDVAIVRFTGTWHDLPVQVVGRFVDETGVQAQIVYTGHNVLDAESAGMQKIDIGYYQAFVPMGSVSDVQGVESVMA